MSEAFAGLKKLMGAAEEMVGLAEKFRYAWEGVGDVSAGATNMLTLILRAW